MKAWLAGPAAFATVAIAAAGALLLREHALAIAVFLGVASLCVPIFWLFVSALRPALPDRKCPRCSVEALVLLEPGNKFGVRCLACDHRDPELYVPYLIDVMDDPEVWVVPPREPSAK